MARWPWSKQVEGESEGAQARVEAEAHLREHKKQRVEVNEVVESLRALRTRNHFSEQIAGLIEMGRHTGR